jgi:dihydroneopterin aldolase
VNYDQIFLRGLDLPTQIGVPIEERASWQTLNADVVMEIESRFEQMQDQLSATIDYAAVAVRLKALAGEKPRQLIETLAAEICSCILEEFNAMNVKVELRKKILPGCDHVAVSLTRGREKNAM